MRQVAATAIFLIAIVATTPVKAEFTQKDFELFANARLGPPDGKPRFWYQTGLFRDVESGETLYVFEYYDTIQQYVDPANPNHRIGIARKLDLIRDKNTGALLETLNGKPVPQAIFPYQLIDMEYKDGAVTLNITQGSGPSLRTHTFTQTRIDHYGPCAHVSIPAHFSVKNSGMPGVAPYSMTMSSHFAMCDEKKAATPRIHWMQGGVVPVPSWAGGDGRKMAYMSITGYRFDNYSELPQRLRSVIEKDYPAWREPPPDLEEVKAMQRGQQ